ncbi:glutathione S-transferase family protein [Alphaproteobacteria bacterium]|nr:glutathione S-transferase family protein [Alphaproteobacteria bacterium]
MGLLVDGVWHDQWYDTKKSGGKFIRTEAQFRNFIELNGDFTPDSGRYHLYVSLACPWAHRTLIYRSLKGLEEHISVSVVNPYMLENGWTFEESFPGTTADHLFSREFLYQIYLQANSKYSGRVTVPVLWDKKNQTIVSNESSEIIRMFNKSFNELTGNALNFYPEQFQKKIDEINNFTYHNINNGVYKVGFATKQEVYEEELDNLFQSLDQIEEMLNQNTYLIADELLECDLRLFPTLLRFDPVYVGHFKCNKKRIIDYPNISRYLQKIKTHPKIQPTINIDHIKTHYYGSHPTINPNGIIPVGPDNY